MIKKGMGWFVLLLGNRKKGSVENEQFYFSKMPDDEMIKRINEKFPFLNKKNLVHLHSQGMYYAWKDNGC